MTIERDLLTLTQWLSPSYPLGSFAYSHGLESAVAAAWVTDAASLQGWLEDIVIRGSGRSDAVFLRLAHAAGPQELAGLAAQARAFAPSRERLREAERQGAAFARTTADIWKIDLPEGVFVVVLGRAVRLLGLDVDLAVSLYLQGFVGNLVSVAQRLIGLGQTDGQRVLAALQGPCMHTARDTRGADLDAVYSNAFLSDIAAMKHETLDTRLFQS